jgi:hypothetical protein
MARSKGVELHLFFAVTLCVIWDTMLPNLLDEATETPYERDRS